MNEELRKYLENELKIASEELKTFGAGPFLAGKATGKIKIIKEIIAMMETLEKKT